MSTQFYKCPNCGRVYNDNKIYYCLNCRYPLKRAEEVDKIKHPELNEHKIIGIVNNQTNSQVTCPFCQSTNVRKIGTGERAVSVFGLGLLSKKINKSFKCKSCGGTF